MRAINNLVKNPGPEDQVFDVRINISVAYPYETKIRNIVVAICRAIHFGYESYPGKEIAQ